MVVRSALSETLIAPLITGNTRPASAMPSFSRHRSRLANSTQPENTIPPTNGDAIMIRNRGRLGIEEVTDKHQCHRHPNRNHHAGQSRSGAVPDLFSSFINEFLKNSPRDSGRGSAPAGGGVLRFYIKIVRRDSVTHHHAPSRACCALDARPPPSFAGGGVPRSSSNESCFDPILRIGSSD